MSILSASNLGNPLAKREQFAISLRKEKKKELMFQKRKKIYQRLGKQGYLQSEMLKSIENTPLLKSMQNLD